MVGTEKGRLVVSELFDRMLAHLGGDEPEVVAHVLRGLECDRVTVVEAGRLEESAGVDVAWSWLRPVVDRLAAPVRARRAELAEQYRELVGKMRCPSCGFAEDESAVRLLERSVR